MYPHLFLTLSATELQLPLKMETLAPICDCELLLLNQDHQVDILSSEH